jgi:hypothetical protein
VCFCQFKFFSSLIDHEFCSHSNPHIPHLSILNVATKQHAGQPVNRGSIPGSDKWFLSSAECSNWFCVPARLLSVDTRVHGVITQNNTVWISAVVRTSNLISVCLSSSCKFVQSNFHIDIHTVNYHVCCQHKSFVTLPFEVWERERERESRSRSCLQFICNCQYNCHEASLLAKTSITYPVMFSFFQSKDMVVRWILIFM